MQLFSYYGKIKLNYYDSQAAAEKENLEEKHEFTFALIDIYDWSLWQYIQKLYKGNRKLSKRFDILFLKNYFRAYDIKSEEPFFKFNGEKFDNFKCYVAITRLRKYFLFRKNKIKTWLLKKF